MVLKWICVYQIYIHYVCEPTMADCVHDESVSYNIVLKTTVFVTSEEVPWDVLQYVMSYCEAFRGPAGCGGCSTWQSVETPKKLPGRVRGYSNWDHPQFLWKTTVILEAVVWQKQIYIFQISALQFSLVKNLKMYRIKMFYFLRNKLYNFLNYGLK